MAVTISDLLSLDLFKNAKIIAGKNGLNNVFSRVTFNDCPLDINVNSKIVRKGDLYINSFYIVKDNKEQLIEFFKFYIDNNSAGIIIIDEYFKELPQEVITMANTYNYPIILIDYQTPYAEIINAAIGMVLFDQNDTIAEMKIDYILDPNISTEEMIKTVEYFNFHFKTYYSAFFIKIDNILFEKERFLISDLKSILNIACYKYKNGLLAFFSYDNINNCKLYIHQVSDLIGKYSTTYKIGVSDSFTSITELSTCINQCITAYSLRNITNDNVIYYNKLNVYKILHPIKNKSFLTDYMKEVLDPLYEYDENYKLDLVKTLEIYIDNDGNYKKAALIMGQHENTIRYRISVAKKILNLENSHFSFIEQVSIALKIRNLLNAK